MVDHSEFFNFASKIVEAQLRATNEKIASLRRPSLIDRSPRFSELPQ
jgi:hypothetical protein